MVRRAGWALILTSVGAISGGCGGSKFEGTTITLLVDPSLSLSTTNAFSVLLQDESGRCPLSPSATLAINGAMYPFGSCSGVSDPFEGNPSFVLRAADGDDQAEMTVDGLVPGVGATVQSPTGGQVAPGGSLTVSIPAGFQGQVPEASAFDNTSDADTYAGTFTYPTASDSQTVDVPAPQHPASYVFWVYMSGTASDSIISADVLSCTGFARCFSQAIDLLGPLAIDVTP